MTMPRALLSVSDKSGLAEFATMWKRRLATGNDVILPVRFADGKFYSPEAQALQHENFEEFSGYRRPSQAGLKYGSAVKRLCERIADLADQAPPWDPAWQSDTPTPPVVDIPQPGWT